MLHTPSSRHDERVRTLHDRDASSPADAGSYLTDGVNLYRELGPLDESPELVLLEDCRTLEVLLAGPEQVRALRRVSPAPRARPAGRTRR